MVPTITAAVPFFPLEIKWVLEVPWTLRKLLLVRSKAAIVKALVLNASGLLTFLYTSPSRTAGD